MDLSQRSRFMTNILEKYGTMIVKVEIVFNLISRLFFTLQIFLMRPWIIQRYFEKSLIYLGLLRMPKLSKANI